MSATSLQPSSTIGFARRRARFLRKLGAHFSASSVDMCAKHTRSTKLKSLCILQHCHCSVAPIDADHAATRMRTCSAKIDAFHRSAGRKPIRPHVSRQTFPLEDVTAREPHLPLDIRRPQHLRIHYRAVHVGTESAERLQLPACEPHRAAHPTCHSKICTEHIAQRRSSCAVLQGQLLHRAHSGNTPRTTSAPATRLAVLRQSRPSTRIL